jgi:hypothetical protein
MSATPPRSSPPTRSSPDSNSRLKGQRSETRTRPENASGKGDRSTSSPRVATRGLWLAHRTPLSSRNRRNVCRLSPSLAHGCLSSRSSGCARIAFPRRRIEGDHALLAGGDATRVAGWARTALLNGRPWPESPRQVRAGGNHQARRRQILPTVVHCFIRRSTFRSGRLPGPRSRPRRSCTRR